METLKGHVIPGMEFILLAMFMNMICKAEQLESKRQTSHSLVLPKYGDETHLDAEDQDLLRDKRKRATSARGGTSKIKLMFAAYCACSITIGIIYEGMGGVIDRGGHFFAQIGHITMYLGFLPASIALGLESGLFEIPMMREILDNSPALSQGAFALGFLNQYYLMRGHLSMKKPGADTLFHQMWLDSILLLICVYSMSVFVRLMNQDKLARALQYACPAFLLLQGIWTCIIGIILFPVLHKMDDKIDMETVQAYFGLCLLFCGVAQFIWVAFIPPRIARFWLGTVAVERETRAFSYHDDDL